MDDIRGVDKITKMLQGLQRAAPQAAHNALVSAVLVVQRSAKSNAPISPTQTQINKELEASRVAKGNANILQRKGKDGKWHDRKRGRKADAARTTPEGLMKSISTSVVGLEGKVFIAANSPAGKYAAYIHDRRYQKPGWEKRGIGSDNKNPKPYGTYVGEKFIERAIKDNQDNIIKLINHEAKKVVAQLGH